MSNEEYWLVTVAFPGHYGVKYLFKCPIVTAPDWPDEDERWMEWSEEQEVVDYFSDLWRKTIGSDGHEFDGQIIFVERQTGLTYLGALNRFDTARAALSPQPQLKQAEGTLAKGEGENTSEPR